MTTPRRAGVVLALAMASAVAAGARQAPGQPPRLPRIPPSYSPRVAESKAWAPRLSSWLEAVSEHAPGATDVPARIIGLWTGPELLLVREDFFALLALCKRELARPARTVPIVYKDTVLAVPEALKLLRLTEEEARRGDANRILLRAAVLHADVVMLVVPFLPRGTGCSPRPTVLVQDGNNVGSGCLSVHWIHSRLLLDGLTPDKAAEAMARLWYHASAAFMLEIGDYANADPHLEHARLQFPDDPGILFEHGLFHEGFAAPFIQTVAVLSGTDRRGAKSHLDEAEELFRKALKENPYFVEARVHRGFVLGQLGRHDDAAVELRAAVETAQGVELRYYAELFLGQAEQSLGNVGAARDHFERASALCPRAQSPLLALALLAREQGNRAGAQEAMRRVTALPTALSRKDDPWWSYYRWQNRGSEVLFGELHKQYAPGGRR